MSAGRRFFRATKQGLCAEPAGKIFQAATYVIEALLTQQGC
jgi:hypothetical protein